LLIFNVSPVIAVLFRTIFFSSVLDGLDNSNESILLNTDALSTISTYPLALDITVLPFVNLTS